MPINLQNLSVYCLLKRPVMWCFLGVLLLMERNSYLGVPWPKYIRVAKVRIRLQKSWASDSLDTHLRKGLLQGGRRMPFVVNRVEVQAHRPHSHVCASLFHTVLGVGQEEQHRDMAFALLFPFTWGCYLHVGFLAQGTGYCFIDAQHR